MKRITRPICLATLALGALLVLPGDGNADPRKKAAVRAPARARAAQPAKEPVKARPTRITFGDDEINATPDQGAGAIVQVNRRLRHSNLIRVRQNFLPELIKSAEDL